MTDSLTKLSCNISNVRLLLELLDCMLMYSLCI